MERILRLISNKEIIIVLLLMPMMSAGMVNIVQQSKASHGNSNSIFQDNGSTSDRNGNNNTPSDTSKTTSSNIITKVIGNDQVSGSGSGDVTCPNGKHLGNAEISFGGFMSKVPLYGSWEVVAINSESGSSLNQGGSFHSGSIGADHYSINGREISDKICGNSSTSSDIQTTATISGQCGQGVTIELNANDGESGTFTGNADCTVNQSP
ncbi:MAG: hypothetical protein M3044_09470 [Thermoproteota archaeon]|nr:hypothetical protein [Thermoproteota archaeon]